MMKTLYPNKRSGLLAALIGLTAMQAAIAEETVAKAPTWADSIEVSGDLRLRYDMIRQDQAADRDRARFRGRIDIAAELAPGVRAVFGLASGGNDPVSTNQSFGDGFTTKDIGINAAFVEWKFHDNWALTAGKMKMPWFRPGGTQLIWDSDLNPEGLMVAYKDKTFFGSAGSFVIAERSSSTESRLNTLQAGIDLPVSSESSLIIAASYFDYTNTIGQAPFYDNNAQGNTVDALNQYVFGYSEVELGAQYKVTVANWPVTVFGDYVVNNDAPREDHGKTIGVTVGAGKAPRSMQFGYAWRDTEADAVNATFNDSDFNGGRTDARGHYITARYVLSDKMYLNGTFMFSKSGGFTGNESDYDRILLDIQFEF
jgi:hypothetical protein